jgi:hypothetical protein
MATHRPMQALGIGMTASAPLSGNYAESYGFELVNYYGDLEWRWQPGNKYALYTGVRLSRLGSSPVASPMAGARERVSLRTALTYHF